jgi:hypothetical protein
MSRRVHYMAAVENGRFVPRDCYAIVTTGAATTERLAMRHARAMLEVQRASNAWAIAARAVELAHNRDEICSAAAPKVKRHLAACDRLMRAHERLRAVEKEVARG